MPAPPFFFLLKELIRRDFKGRYAGSLLGFFWSFIQPLWQLVLYAYVFSIIARLPLDGEATDRFWVFLFSGLLPWLAIQEGMTRGCTAITDNASLVGKLAFPSQILVVVVVATALLHQAITLTVFVAVLGSIGELSWASLPLLIPAIVLQTLLTIGLGLGLAAIQVYFRDMIHLLGMLASAWFFTSPIVYPTAAVPEKVQSILRFNPLSVLVAFYRRALLGGEGLWPSGSWHLLGITLLVFGAGWWLFRRFKARFVDEL